MGPTHRWLAQSQLVVAWTAGVASRHALCDHLLQQSWRSPRRERRVGTYSYVAPHADPDCRLSALMGDRRRSRPAFCHNGDGTHFTEQALSDHTVASQDGGTMGNNSVSSGPSHHLASPDAPQTAGIRRGFLSSQAVPATRPWTVQLSLLPDATWAAYLAAGGPASAVRFSSR